MTRMTRIFTDKKESAKIRIIRVIRVPILFIRIFRRIKHIFAFFFLPKTKNITHI